MATPIRYAHELSGAAVIYDGYPLAANQIDQIPYQLYDKLATSDDFMTAIAAGTVGISFDGTNIISSVSEAIDAIKVLSDPKITLLDDNGEAITAVVGPQGPSGYGIYALGVTTGAGVLQASQGLTVNRVSTGVYDYTFTDPTNDTNYAVNSQIYDLATNTDTNVFIVSRTTTGFQVRIGVGDNGTSIDVLLDADHTVAVIGPQGPGGLTNVYDIWLDNGNSGTINDFLATLVGAQGATGPQGIQGITGAAGAQGIQGIQGDPGAQGDPGTQGIQGIQGVQGDPGPTGATGATGPQGPVSIFGSEYAYEESLGESSTTNSSSISPTNKLSLSVTGLPAGTYRLGWSYSWSGSSTGADFRAEITQVGVGQIMYHSQEPKDSGTDQYHRVAGFHNLTLSGDEDFDLNFWEEGGSTAYIRAVRMEFWRVI